MTGHDVTGELPDNLNLAALADPMATTVVFMGKRTFGKMQKMLEAHGLPADTPALLAEAVATSEQKLTRTTMGALAEKLAQETSPNAALILYGPLAEMDEGDDD